MRLYVIGPVTGRRDLNRPAFEAARVELDEAGYDATIPHDVVPPDATREQAMRASVRMLLECDGVAVLHDWNVSEGAKLEKKVANACGIYVHDMTAWVLNAQSWAHRKPDRPESDNLPEETEGKASGGVPDATPHGIGVELPRDAEGREIPLDTEVMYAKDGTEVEASGFVYTYIRGEEPFWHAKGDGCLFYPGRMHLTPPDSWERLLEDLDRSAAKKKPSDNLPTCNYFGANDCSKCPASKSELLCGKESFKDIADRIRKLRGDDA